MKTLETKVEFTISDAQRIILRELGRHRGYKKQTNGNIWICCPFHMEKTPSCGINIDPTNRKVGLGTWNCMGCPEKGDWNKLAAKLGLEQLPKSAFAHTHMAKKQTTKLQKALFGEGLNMDSLAEEFGIGIHLEFPKENKWRGISGKLLNRIGARLIYDRYNEDTGVLLPISVDGELVGGIKAVMTKEEGDKKKLGYLTSEGEWVKRMGLFPYDLVVEMLKHTGLTTVVLVEGSRDALRLIQKGIPALCILGTQNWSTNKMKLLLSLGVDRVVICMDGDGAGVSATNRLRSELKNYFDLKVIRMMKYSTEEGKKIDPGNAPEYVIENIRKALR